MQDIIKIMRNISDYNGGNGRVEESIAAAENELKLKFASEYRQYLKEIGLASFDGHEMTGLCKSPRLNVVEVSLYEKENNEKIPEDFYVIEQTNIDGIVVWQNKIGEVFYSQPNRKPVKMFDSLCEYIKM
ncbi:MAG: SMI1/KNR4 family protein [Ruminococcus sp.]|nr:SMI1/KNR4 family protein [Ruminococcus sp.]